MSNRVVSSHEVAIFRTLRERADWMSAREVAAAAAVAHTTAKLHLRRMAELGVVDVQRVFPGYRYKWGDKVPRGSAGHVERLIQASELIARTSEDCGTREGVNMSGTIEIRGNRTPTLVNCVCGHNHLPHWTDGKGCNGAWRQESGYEGCTCTGFVAGPRGEGGDRARTGRPCAHGLTDEDCATCSEEGYEPAPPPPEVIALVATLRARGINYGEAEDMLYAAWQDAEGGAREG